MVHPEVVVLQDHLGLSERVRALQAVHPHVRVFSPPGRAIGHAEEIAVPDTWLPVGDALSYDRKCWFKADALALAAARTIDADFYWFIEADVVATAARWQALFSDHAGNRADCVSLAVSWRGDDPNADRYWPTAPPDADQHFIMAVYRLSRRAVDAAILMAEDLRECFSEIAVPLVIKRSGFSFDLINRRQTHCTSQSVGTRRGHIAIDRRYLCHPQKTNTFAP